MATDISICSNALLKLGAPPIHSFQDQTQTSGICANIWPGVRDAVLRAHPWNCATKRVILAPETATPAWGYAHQFVIPADCLRIMEIEDSVDYRIESGRILSDETAINLKYIWRNTDPVTYDPALVDAMTQRMTAELAYPLTRSDQRQVTETNKYTAMIREARFYDATEQPQDEFLNYPADRRTEILTRWPSSTISKTAS